ncbi:TBC1 domain member 31, partial [Rhizophlyctis rosea]
MNGGPMKELAFLYRGSTLYVWNLVEKRLVHEILVPAFEGEGASVGQVGFVGGSKIACVLSNQGTMIFVDVVEARFVGQLKGRRFKSFAISPDGRLLSAIMDDKKYTISLVRLDAVWERVGGQVAEEAMSDEEAAEEEEVREDVLEEERKRVEVSMPEGKVMTFYELVETKEQSPALNRRKLRQFLNHYGTYPDEWRTYIWRYLLHLPENRESYESLLAQGIHPSFKDFRKKYPLKSERVGKSMEKVLSTLAYWSPIFEGLDTLPSLVFPFVGVFRGDLFSGVEVVMSVLMNWCQKWWEYYPNPPFEVLDVVEDLLGYWDGEVLEHFVGCGVTSQVYAWLPLRTLFSEMFSRKDWLMVWDHLVSAPVGFLYSFLVAVLVENRVGLLGVRASSDFEYFFTHPPSTKSVASYLHRAYEIHRGTPASIKPEGVIATFTPLPKGQYPIFKGYPEFVVGYRKR